MVGAVRPLARNCHDGLPGDGRGAVASYQVQDFDRIYFSGTGTLNVVQDSTSQGTVRAQGAEAVLSHLAV